MKAVTIGQLNLDAALHVASISLVRGLLVAFEEIMRADPITLAIDVVVVIDYTALHCIVLSSTYLVARPMIDDLDTVHQCMHPS